MAKSCKGLAQELVKCLSESDCVRVIPEAAFKLLTCLLGFHGVVDLTTGRGEVHARLREGARAFSPKQVCRSARDILRLQAYAAEHELTHPRKQGVLGFQALLGYGTAMPNSRSRGMWIVAT